MLSAIILAQVITMAAPVDLPVAQDPNAAYKEKLIPIGTKVPNFKVKDDAGNDFAPMQHASLDAGYLTAAEDPQSADFTGDVFPSVVDIDEDGLAEIVIVHATGSNFTYTKYDDADTNFALLP